MFHASYEYYKMFIKFQRVLIRAPKSTWVGNFDALLMKQLVCGSRQGGRGEGRAVG